MLSGELVFIRQDRVKGENANGAYDFANITFSDGLESFTLPMEMSILPMVSIFKRGDNVLVTVDVSTVGRNARFTVSDVIKNEKIKAV